MFVIKRRLLRHCLMDSPNETQSVERVIDRLAQKFPSMSKDNIARAVHREHHSHDGDPVRTYIPVLIERAVSDLLRQQTDTLKSQ